MVAFPADARVTQSKFEFAAFATGTAAALSLGACWLSFGRCLLLGLWV